MAERKRTLPDFNEPPVVEVVLGVQFVPLALFSVQHFGLFWAKVREDYPQFVPKPPLPTIIEGFESGAPKGLAIEVGLASGPDVRGWYIDSSETRLMQVQKDRFHCNWRKRSAGEVYPHYENIEPIFEKEWKRFTDFLAQEKLAVPEVNQCEVTYVNHIEVGKGWKSYGELNKVFSCWSGGSSGSFLPEPEKVIFTTRYVIEQSRGRLHIAMQPAVRRHDAKEVLQLTLTARGKPNSSSLEDIVGWFELGHQWIVKGFTDFTTKDMHKLWGRKQ